MSVSKFREPCEPPCHKLYHSDLNEGFCGFCETLVIFCKAAVYAGPCQGSLDDPSFRQDVESAPIALYDLQWSRAVFAGNRSPIPAIGADFLNEGEAPDKLLARERQTVAIL